jgi:hypothetical protein
MMHAPIYPDAPGHRGVDTSVDAAEAVQPELGRLQRLVRDAIEAAGQFGATTNEIAIRLNIDRGSVQPRTSELRVFGVIEDSGGRRRNANGKMAIVWTLVPDVNGPADV